jgi:hypothetical protein
VESSMPRDQHKRYARAVWYAVDSQDLPLAAAEEFGSWFARIGHLLHKSIDDAYANWYADHFPGVTDGNDD